MRVPKGAIRHEQVLEQIDVHAAVLKARRATEEIEWQAQVKRVKEALAESEASEWAALRVRTAAMPVETQPRRPQPKKPALVLSRVSKGLEQKAADNVTTSGSDTAQERAAEEREWQEARARARLAEEREWEQLIARARVTSSGPIEIWPVHRPARFDQHARPEPRVVAWP